MADESQSIGTARLDVEVDVSQLDAAIATAKGRLADMSTDAQRQYQQLGAAEKQRIDRLLTQADSLNLTRAQQLAYNAALRTSGPILEEITRKLAENEAKLRVGGAQLNAYGLSAKQTALAMRQVPAQLTDIFVGLASGQRPLMILLQQGGQLKDLFGGIVPAARALGAQLLGLINPYTLTAAAATAAGLAYYKGSQEAFEFEKAIAMSGNAAGVTSGQLALAAGRIDQYAGTQRNAASVLAQIASTGRVGSTVLETAAKAAIQLNRVAGVELDDTIRNLVALGEKPTEAARKLYLQYGYLNQATVDRIKALEDEGRAAEAATLAQREFATEGIRRAEQLEEHLGTLPFLAREAKESLAEMWDAILGLGRGKTPEERLREISLQLTEMAARPEILRTHRFNDELEALGKEQLALQRIVIDRERAAKAAGEEAEKRRALAQWDDIAQANLSKREKLEKEIQRIRTLGLAAGKSEAEIQHQIANARERLATKTKEKENQDDNSAKTLLETMERQIEANRQMVSTGDKVTAGEALLIRVRQTLADATNTMTDATRAQLIARRFELNASEKSAKAADEERKAKEALARQNSILQQQSQNRRDGNDVALQGFGRGQDSMEQLQRRIAINREYEAELRRIGDRSVAEDKKVWDQLADNAKDQRDQMLREEEEFQRKRAELMADPWQGAQAAFEDYLESARDVSTQSEDLFSNAFEGAEDALVRFATTGKLSFKSLANEIIADLIRIQIRAQLASVLSGLFGNSIPKGIPMAGGPTIPSGVGFAASGGPVEAGKPYVVGEQGPELILPRAAGMVIPNHKLGGAGGPNINITVNNAPGVDAAMVSAGMQQLKEEIRGLVAEDAFRRRGAWARV